VLLLAFPVRQFPVHRLFLYLWGHLGEQLVELLLVALLPQADLSQEVVEALHLSEEVVEVLLLALREDRLFRIHRLFLYLWGHLGE